MYNIPVIIPYIDEDELKEIEKVLQSGWVAQGPKAAEFEKMVAEYENVAQGIAVTSCTTALHLALMAMGVDESCDCIVPSFTFVATPNAVTYTGATPIIVDIDPDTYNIDVSALEELIEKQYENNDGRLINKTTGKTLKVVIAVNLFGLCADIPRLNTLKEKYGFEILQDSACAFGAKIDGKMEASFGNTTCLSFHPRKSITTGEGGMILTNDASLAKTTRMLRSHGASMSEIDRHKNKGYLLPNFDVLGYNYRMTDLQAAMGIAQMKKMEFITETRRKKAELYTNLINEMNIDFIDVPFVPENYYHTYQSYVCRLNMDKLGFKKDVSGIEKAAEFRNELMDKLDSIGIATRVGTHACHMLGYYKNKFGFEDMDLPNAYRIDKTSITLPLYVQMSDENQRAVLEELLKAAKTIEK